MTKQRTVGLMLFPGFEMLDAYGPLELFSMHKDHFRILAFAASMDPVASNNGGPATQPDRTFADDAPVDILLVPGGTGARSVVEDEAALAWVRRTGAQAEWVTSVCTGSLILGKAGLLDGKRATTNKLAFSWVADQVPGVDWQASARWVVDGNTATSSGVSAGMDMALDMIERLHGPKAASDAALWAEYERNANPDHDPFAKDIR
ncbi:MAG: DJ-1/PfpI family protein [Pseudomonadota bacterium]